LVGRSSYCFSVDKSIPVVGDLSNINFETLAKVNPTHILVQPPESGVGEPLMKAAKEHGWIIASWHLNSLDEIGAMIRGIPGAIFQPGTVELEQATGRAAELENAIAQAMSPGGKKLWHGSVLLVSNNNPILAFGTGTYLSDVLTGFGCTNAVKNKGWIQLSMEDVTKLNPQGLMLALPGFDILAGMPAAAGVMWELDVPAVNERRVGVITNWDSFLPSSAVVSSIKEIRELLVKWQELSPSPEPGN
jgi:ABC-type Fe3+-hydroxamate transport system substrate-binding protein